MIWQLDSVYSCNVYRHAVPSAQTTRDWWRENYHPKPNGPAKVGIVSKCDSSLTWWACRPMNDCIPLSLQKGPWEGWVWGAWGLCSGCARQHRRGEGEFLFDFSSLILKILGKANHLRCMLTFAIQAKDGGQRTTVYKRDPNKVYGLKMKTSRTFFSEMERRFDTMPFTLR